MTDAAFSPAPGRGLTFAEGEKNLHCVACGGGYAWAGCATSPSLALRASSFLCGTGYGAGARLLEVDGVATWVPMVQQRPPWEFHYATDGISLRADGVPCCPLAGADLTNDPFRAATPMTRALVAAWQDWDGVFAYWWGYFTDKQPLTGDGDYGRQGLRYGTPESRSTCFEVCHDEIVLSQHRAASATLSRTSGRARA